MGDAVENARAKAEKVTRAAGVRLGRVLIIKQPGREAIPRLHLLNTIEPAPMAMPVEPGSTSLDAMVEVTWAIEPR